MNAWLETEDGIRVPLNAVCSIGRSPKNNLVLNDERVSRRHALIHCQAGLNRSGLITALTLTRGFKGVEPMCPVNAIALLREKRCDAVLCNAAFFSYLVSLEEETCPKH